MGVVHPHRMEGQQSRSIARWPSFMHMHVSVYLEAESPCQFPVFQTTHFGALVRLLFHVSRTSWTSTSCSTAAATTMELYRRARGALPFVSSLILGGAGVLLLLGSSGFFWRSFWCSSGVLLAFDNTEEHQKNPEEHQKSEIP